MDNDMSMDGINLLEPDDDSPDPDRDMELTEDSVIGSGPIPPAVRQAIVIEKANQAPTRLIAIRYQVSEATVNRIWREFCASAAKVRRIADEPQSETKVWLRGKALTAIESGLDCERDPYRRGALGVQVMKGIGEFKESEAGARVNILINALPPEWKQRYIGNGGTDNVQGEEK